MLRRVTCPQEANRKLQKPTKPNKHYKPKPAGLKTTTAHGCVSSINHSQREQSLSLEFCEHKVRNRRNVLKGQCPKGTSHNHPHHCAVTHPEVSGCERWSTVPGIPYGRSVLKTVLFQDKYLNWKHIEVRSKKDAQTKGS
jgi:hypothetical protein